MRLFSLSLVLFTVACGPSNDSKSDLMGSGFHATKALDSSLNEPIAASADYPLAPIASLTTGVECTKSTTTRQPGNFLYCVRNVSKNEKDQVIQSYDDLGYHLQNLDRGKIKIDHMIPLCMGGANDRKNLWPQYETVYKRTDPLEASLCVAFTNGYITREEAKEQMHYAKENLNEAISMYDKIQALMNNN